MYNVHYTSPMMTNEITPSVDYNLWLKRLDIQLSNSNSNSKLLSQRIRKQYYKNLGTSVINTAHSSPPNIQRKTEALQ